MQPGEVRQAGNQPLGGEGRHHGQFQRVALGAAGADLLGVPFDMVQMAPHARRVFPACFGQLQPAPYPGEQRHAEPLLQQGHLPADGALGEREFVGGTGEAAQPGGGLEREQRVQVGDVLSHGGRGRQQVGATWGRQGESIARRTSCARRTTL
ncbi:hypothetical protein D3C72_1190440 [compost metagenome]